MPAPALLDESAADFRPANSSWLVGPRPRASQPPLRPGKAAPSVSSPSPARRGGGRKILFSLGLPVGGLMLLGFVDLLLAAAGLAALARRMEPEKASDTRRQATVVAESTTRQFDKSGHFSIELSQNWTPVGGDFPSFAASSEREINVGEFSRPETLDQIAEVGISVLQDKCPGMVIESREEVYLEVSGRAIHFRTINYENGVRIKRDHYFVGNESTKFWIIYIRPASTAAASDAEFTRAIQTFRIETQKSFRAPDRS